VFGIGHEGETKEEKGPQLRRGFLRKGEGVFWRGKGAWRSWAEGKGDFRRGFIGGR
jgi:hypothetical protein